MTARPVTTSLTLPASMIDGQMTVMQNLERDGPLFVASPGAEQFPVSLRGRNRLSHFIDIALRDSGALITSGDDHVNLQTNFTSGTSVSYPFGAIPAQGFRSVAFQTVGTAPGSGMGIEISLDNGASWVLIQSLLESATTPQVSTLQYGQSTLYVADLPPCTHFRLRVQHAATVSNRYSLTASTLSRLQYMAVRLSDAQMLDNTTLSITATAQSLTIGGISPTKSMRPIASDASVAVKAQAASGSNTSGPFNLPFYGHVMAQAIARVDAQNYNRDQPAALQANNRGELKIDVAETRAITEQQLLAAQASYLQQLDPNWGFELR